MTPELPPISDEVRQALITTRDWINKVLDASPVGLLEAVSTPEVGPERIPLTDKSEEDGLFFDSTNGEIFGGKQTITLSRLQRDTFKMLVLAKGRVVIHEQLFTLWPEEKYCPRMREANLERTSSLMKRIRVKLKGVSEFVQLKSERGVGYCLILGKREEQDCFWE